MAASATKIMIGLDGSDQTSADACVAHLRTLSLGQGKIRDRAKRAIAAQPGKISDQIPHRRRQELPGVRSAQAAATAPATAISATLVGGLGGNRSKPQVIAAYKAAAAAAETVRTATGNVVSIATAVGPVARTNPARQAA